MLDESKLDAAVGPIRVKGARKGDVLCIEVLDIMLADQGVMMTNCGLGTLGERITEPNTKVIKIKEGKAFFSEDLLLPLTPMVGVIGVLPEKGIFPATVPGDFGGGKGRNKGLPSRIYRWCGTGSCRSSCMYGRRRIERDWH